MKYELLTDMELVRLIEDHEYQYEKDWERWSEVERVIPSSAHMAMLSEAARRGLL